MPQLWEKHYLTDITGGQIEHAGAGDVELPTMFIYFFLCGCTHVIFFSVAPFDVQKKNIRGFT